MNDFNLVKLDALAEPAKILINKISEAVGGIFKPFQIKRVAKAEAQAKVIDTKAQIKIIGLKQRALHRFAEEEVKKQINMENITRKALPHLSADSHPEKLENDWIANFFDKCRLISDEEMQALWAKVLAGEANSPGKYSKRTVNFLSSLDRDEAEVFSKICSFSCMIEEDFTLLIYKRDDNIYKENGINFSVLVHLDSIGLIKYDGLSLLRIEKLEQKIYAKLGNKKILIEFPNPENNTMQIGSVILTQVGGELAPISGFSTPVGFEEYIIDKWKKLGYKIDPN